MIDHVSASVRDLTKAAAFYEAALAPLGLSRLVERDRTVGFGKEFPEFWINHRPKMAELPVDNGAHIALAHPQRGTGRCIPRGGNCRRRQLRRAARRATA